MIGSVGFEETKGYLMDHYPALCKQDTDMLMTNNDNNAELTLKEREALNMVA